MSRNWSAHYVIASSALVLVALLSLVVGAAGLSLSELVSALQHEAGSEAATAIVYEIRIPRLLAAALVGATLALAGTILQASFSNPVVDPSLVGLSGVAGLGAMVGGLLTANGVAATVVAIAATIAAMHWLSSTRTDSLHLLLSGFALGAFTQGALATLSNFGAFGQGKSMNSWLFGSVAVATYDALPWLVVGLGVASALLWRLGVPMDILAADPQSAFALGVDVTQLRRRLLLAAAVVVAPAVVWFGVVGFVGLLVPHALRALGVINHRQLLPLSAICGAIVVLLADTAARSLIPMTEIPLTVLLALAGAPLLLASVRRLK